MPITPKTGTESGRERAKEQKSKGLGVTRLGRVAPACCASSPTGPSMVALRAPSPNWPSSRRAAGHPLLRMSASILDDHAGYYCILKLSQKGELDIINGLQWFLATILNSLEQVLARTDCAGHGSLLTGTPQPKATCGADQSAVPPARWLRKRFRERYQRGAIPNRGQGIQSDCAPTSERPAGRGLHRATTRSRG